MLPTMCKENKYDILGIQATHLELQQIRPNIHGMKLVNEIHTHNMEHKSNDHQFDKKTT